MSIMNQAEVKLQRDHFDTSRFQYDQHLIVQPPPHTVLEIGAVLRHLARLGLQPGDTVIDFGAGTGRLTIPLLQHGFRVVAVDISRKSLDALDKLTQQLALKGLTLSKQLPAKASARAIIGADVLHHVEMDEILPQLKHALAPDGHLIFSEPGALNPAWYLFVALNLDWKVEKRIVNGNILTLEHVFKRNGFTHVDIEGLGLLPRPIFNRWPRVLAFNEQLGNVPGLRWFAYRYIVDATH